MGEEASLGDYAAAAGGAFLKADDLKIGETVQKQVRETGWRTFEDGDKPLLVFEDETILVLNKTNAQYLVDAGYDFDSLPGVVLTLGLQPTQFKGESRQGIRVVGAEKA